MVAALGGGSVSSSPDSYVVEVFDNYSATYEQTLLQELEYCVPLTLRHLLESTLQEEKRFRHGLDLGCGTGLGGEAFSDTIEILDGTDLSEKMIAIAKGKPFYRQLHCMNIDDFLASSEERFDFFLAADVFAYVGDLKETFSLLKKCADSNALFCFSTEKNDREGYRLQQSGRFAHSSTYIEKLAGLTGWKVTATTTKGLRKEKGAWVQGDLWVLRALSR
jgi:predicted TPR repeat methyltransferase